MEEGGKCEVIKQKGIWDGGRGEEEGRQVKKQTRKRAKRIDRVEVVKRSQGRSRFMWMCW